ncbi:hypothetical protein R3W88_019644 [Solanum pinnatisectum]|uniref:Uncharacterized protein n=1 Tax=Solanum pinnatisectum TaxID=50273 RepID=A0AAV9KK33_9SOLN|nr:hypothetical protein R3W88_019644 [Solanum pinnatisectum]
MQSQTSRSSNCMEDDLAAIRRYMKVVPTGTSTPPPIQDMASLCKELDAEKRRGSSRDRFLACIWKSVVLPQNRISPVGYEGLLEVSFHEARLRKENLPNDVDWAHS